MASVDNPLLARLRRQGHVIVDETPKLDLDAYIANYRGRTRFDRLFLIGTTSSYLCLDALRAAVAEARRGKDVERYEKAVAALAEAAASDAQAQLDTAWTTNTSKFVKVETDKMELELKGYKNNLIKESIRMGYKDLGKQYQSIGDLANSAKSFNKMSDYMTTNAHLVNMCMHLIMVAIDQKNWYVAIMNAQRVWTGGSTKFEEAKKQAAKLTSALGIAELASQNLRVAAESFINTDPRMVQAKMDDPEDEESFNEVLTPNDVAIYGALCALASFDRSELHSRVLEHKTFRNYLELEPHLRRAISFFVSSKYSACLSILIAWRADFLLDIYLQPCFTVIFERIRRKAIQQYFVPFSCVTLKALSQAFNAEEADIEKEVTAMIKRHELDARIDLVERVFLAKSPNARNVVHKQTLDLAKEYERTTLLRLLRMAIVNAGLEVKSAKDKASFGATSQGHSMEGFYESNTAGDLAEAIARSR